MPRKDARMRSGMADMKRKVPRRGGQRARGGVYVRDATQGREARVVECDGGVASAPLPRLSRAITVLNEKASVTHV